MNAAKDVETDIGQDFSSFLITFQDGKVQHLDI